jgi:hypothetical protein
VRKAVTPMFELIAFLAGLLLIGYLIFTVLRPEKF